MLASTHTVTVTLDSESTRGQWFEAEDCSSLRTAESFLNVSERLRLLEYCSSEEPRRPHYLGIVAEPSLPARTIHSRSDEVDVDLLCDSLDVEVGIGDRERFVETHRGTRDEGITSRKR